MIGDLEKKDFLSLYFHIPFCKKKCPYCHFYVQKTNDSIKKKFLESLKLEVLHNLDKIKQRTVYSIYIGGGTPSQLTIFEIEDFLSFLFKLPLHFDPDCEITMEANPEDLSETYLKDLACLKINRLSIGVQSLDENLLKVLNRGHSAKKAIESIETASKVGFQNISIDLMYELPFQTLSSFEKTLDEVSNLPITHLSLYNLVFEPQTVFFKNRKTLAKHLPEDLEAKKMLDLAIFYLEKTQLMRYEISAFCKKDFHSKHNSGYWLGRDFLGFGPSAFSYFEQRRYQNICHIGQYIDCVSQNKSPISFEEKLDQTSRVKELIAINLRLLEGCNMAKFRNAPFLKVILDNLIQQDYLEMNSDLIKLTPKGILFYDDVGPYFV